MKRSPIFYPENELVEKHQKGEYNWLEYIRHHSNEWCDEYEQFCAKNDFDEEDDTAAQLFVENKNKELEDAIAAGEA